LSRIEDSRKGGTDYRYDPVGRLIEAISPVAKERFAFDPASNIIDPVRTAETPASRPSPVRPESTLPVEVPKVLGNLLKAYAGMHFEYDARGNLVRKRTPAGEQEYEWDEFNRLLSARVAETARQSQARYFYDAFGRRIAKEVNGERTVFGWDGDTLAYESGGERGTHYLYEPGTFVPLAQYVAGPVEGIATPEWKSTDRYVPEEDPLQKVPERRGDAAVFYYHCDQIGTPQLLTDDDGDVVWEASYKAWGEAREVIARASKAAGIVPGNLLRFQGQQFDGETGLHYNRHRYCDPSSGRFISKDLIGLAGGINAYQYAPNPIGWIDPLGLARFGSGKGTHTAQVTVRSADGSQRNCGVFQSGNMTPDEKALGFPQNTLATHTEARAVSQVPLEPGDHMTIDGQYPPCTSCKGKMKARATQSGATIQYNWQEDGQQKTWMANPSNGCK